MLKTKKKLGIFVRIAISQSSEIGYFFEAAIMFAILRNRVLIVPIFETVRLFRIDYSGVFASFAPEERFYA